MFKALKATSPVVPLLACLSILLALASPASCDLLEQGAELERQGRLEDLLRLFRNAAKAGDPAGAYGLGVLYFQGTGVDRDPQRSTEWFLTAAQQGYVPAQYNLGNAYLRGDGVGQDLDLAAEWWRKAAVSGYARAQFNLGSLILGAAEEEELREEGIAWLRASAEQGFPKAGERLREMGEPVRFEYIEPDPTREPARSEARLLTLGADGYCIQVFSGSRAGSAQRFVDEHRLAGLALGFRFPLRGALWSGVCHGWYPDRNSAQNALQGLKPALRKSEPWIRSIGDVQRQIQAARLARKLFTPGVSENMPAAADHTPDSALTVSQPGGAGTESR
jgi:hypothetical protein